MAGEAHETRGPLRCACGTLLRPPPGVPAVRCPSCARVLRLGGPSAAATTRPRLRAGALPDDAEDALDLDVGVTEWVVDEAATDDGLPASSPPPSGLPGPGVAARLLRPMPRRRTDPLLLWGSVAAAGILLGVLGYLLGHSHGMRDAAPGPALQVAPPPDAETVDRTATGRELFRLCRVLDETRPTFDDPLEEKTAEGRRRLDAWIAPFKTGWAGPLGKAIRDLDLKLDWECHVTGYDAGRGFACTTRAGGGTAFRVNAFGLGARFWSGQETIRTGDRIVLSGVREALRVDRGASMLVDAGCEITIVVDGPSLARVVR